MLEFEVSYALYSMRTFGTFYVRLPRKSYEVLSESMQDLDIFHAESVQDLCILHA